MVSLYGTYIKSIWRNEKTGYSQFTIVNNGNVFVCEGVIPNLPFKTPLFILCEKTRYEEESIYKASKVELCAYDETAMIEFVKTRFFFGIGPSAAEDAMKVYGKDLFSYINNHFHDEHPKTVNPSVVKLMSRLKEMVALQRVISFFAGLDGTYIGAIKMFEKYGSNALEESYKNPYILLTYGITFEKCDEIAQKRGIYACDKNRVAHIVEYVMKKNQDNGNTRINIYDLEELIHRYERTKEGGYHTGRLFIAEALTSDKYVVIEESGKIYVYFTYDYITEQRIVENIARISKSAISCDIPGNLIEKVSKKIGIKYSEEQEFAFGSLYSSGIKIITGGPGTGKTTLLNGLLTAYEAMHPFANIMLCAPTGCAAARMKESTGRCATTLHKLLKIQPFMNTFDCTEKLEADCIVVDEASMIDIYLFNALLSSIKNGATLYILGDKDQLPSIGAGDVLKDLLTSNIVESYELSHIFRQEGDNLIVDNAYNVINGITKISTDKSFQVRRFNTEREILDEVEKIVLQCKEKGCDKYKIYTPSRNVKFETGSIKLNRLIQKSNIEKEKGVRYGFYRFAINDKVIFNKNNYEKGYYNGEEGIITDIQKVVDSVHITIKAEDDTIHLSNADINDIDLGYALTAHKSQGSECENAIIVIPQNPRNMLRRKLLYVEITRAKKNVVILSEGNALERCISSYHENMRNTGLLYKLGKMVF